MKNEILLHLNEAAKLESLYRADKASFKRAFNSLYPEIQDKTIAHFWNERLNFAKEDISWGTAADLIFVIIASTLAGIVAKLPDILSIHEDFFYPRNAGFIIFPFLSAYFAWKNNLSVGKIVVITSVTISAVWFINFIPFDEQGDTLTLSCIHLLVVLWSVLGFSFVGQVNHNNEKRLGYLKYNGDLVVMTTLIGIAGGILTGITIGLFSLIGLQIEEFWFQNVVVFGVPAAPLLGTFLIRNNPQLVGKVSPVIAKIFSPVVLVMLIIYLAAIIYSGKDPYNDREFLLIFNVLLIGVLAIIFFSVAETSGSKSQLETWILLLLCIVTIIVNGIALSAIIFRISEWGITPNRVAVLGANLLVLGNLVLVTWQLFKVLSNRTDLAAVRNSIAAYLPVYIVWAVLVTFLFPFFFGFQ